MTLHVCVVRAVRDRWQSSRAVRMSNTSQLRSGWSCERRSDHRCSGADDEVAVNAHRMECRPISDRKHAVTHWRTPRLIHWWPLTLSSDLDLDHTVLAMLWAKRWRHRYPIQWRSCLWVSQFFWSVTCKRSLNYLTDIGLGMIRLYLRLSNQSLYAEHCFVDITHE